MELSRKKQIKRRLLPGFDNGLDYINYNYSDLQALYNPYVGRNYNPNQWNLNVNTRDFMPTLNPKTDMPVYTKFPIPGENKRRSYSDVNIPAILGFGADVYNQFLYNRTANDMITDAGTSSGNIEGVGYTRYNPIDINKPVSEVLRSRDLDTVNTGIKGALIGSELLPGAGTILGGIVGLGAGILGGHKRKKEAERRAKEAAILALNLTTNNRAGAQTEALQQDYALHAAEGKDSGTYTPDGIMQFQPNSLVSKGESILSNLDPMNPEEASGNVVKHGSGIKDDVLANLKESDVVLGKDIDWRTGLSFKKEGLPYTMALEHINNKYENNGNDLSSLSKPTQRLQLEQVNRLKQPIVEKLKDLADQLKYQHDVTGYNQLFMAARGKDRTIPPMLPSASVQQMMDYLFAAGDRDVANGRLGDEQSYQHRKYVEESGKDLYNFGEKHKKNYKSLPKGGNPFVIEDQEYYQQYLDALKKYPTVDDYINGEMNEYRKYWQNKKEQSENRMKSNRLFGEFANGKDYHTIPNALGALASIGQMIQAGKQSIKTSNSYAPNKYAGRALNTLASLDINEQPGLQQINKAARYADYGVNNSGGLSGSLKYLGRLANANNVYTNYLKFLSDVQAQRNAYKSQYASTAATIGAQEAQNRQSANQWDLDYYSKAHAARLGGILMGVRNLMDYINHWSADASKLNQFNKMYDLYAMDVYNNANKYR